MSSLSLPCISTRVRLFAVLTMFALLFSVTAFAQTTVSTGSIAGTVTDASGAVVPHAKITMTGSTGQIAKLTSSDQGSYSSASACLP